jgi:hypothetical protein
LVKTARTAAFALNAGLDRESSWSSVRADRRRCADHAVHRAGASSVCRSGTVRRRHAGVVDAEGEHDNGEDEAGFDKLRDAYYWSRLLAGEDGGITMDQAATLRSKASTQASSMPAETTSGAPRGGAWTSAGPDPIVQVGRTSNTFEAVSGRIGALAVRNDGTIILGAAQGGIWTYDATTKLHRVLTYFG